MKRIIAIALLSISISIVPTLMAHDDSEKKPKKRSTISRLFYASRGLTALYLGAESFNMYFGSLLAGFNHPDEAKKLEKALNKLPGMELFPTRFSGMYPYLSCLVPYFLLKQGWSDLDYAFSNE